MSACPSAWPSAWPSLRNILVPTRQIIMKFEYSSKICTENSSLIKIYEITDTLHDKHKVHLWQYLPEFLYEGENVSDEIVEKFRTHILWAWTIFRKSCLLWDNVEKYCWAGKATDGNTAHAHDMLDT